MTDATLAALLRACVENPSDAASLAGLADRLLDCSAQDRVEALKGLADAAHRLKHHRAAMSSSLPEARGARRIAYRRQLSQMDVHDASFDLFAVEAAWLRERAGVELLRAVEPGHWYAVRLIVERDQSIEDRKQRRVSIDVRLDVAPLDGGRIESA